MVIDIGSLKITTQRTNIIFIGNGVGSRPCSPPCREFKSDEMAADASNSMVHDDPVDCI
jgi:hypothetical protein